MLLHSGGASFIAQATQRDRRDGGGEAAQTEQDDEPQRSFDEMTDRWGLRIGMPMFCRAPLLGPLAAPALVSACSAVGNEYAREGDNALLASSA